MKVKVLDIKSSIPSVEGRPLINRSFNQGGAGGEFQRAREVQRALVAAKMKRIFAKPLVCCLKDEHLDSISFLGRDREAGGDVCRIYSGSSDNVIKLWNLGSRSSELTLGEPHGSIVVRGAHTISRQLGAPTSLISAHSDGQIKLWDISGFQSRLASDSTMTIGNSTESTSSSSGINDMDVVWGSSKGKSWFATCGSLGVDVWDYSHGLMNKPIQSYSSDGFVGQSRVSDSFSQAVCVRFNPSSGAGTSEPLKNLPGGGPQACLLAAVFGNTKLAMIDTRAAGVAHLMTLNFRSRCVAWCPEQPDVFTLGSDSGKAYTFSMRNYSRPLHVHVGHVRGINSVDYSPAGSDLVTGSDDCTVRIFDYNSQACKEVYHTKRMQKVGACVFAGDGKFVVSGSEDANIRVWKARSSEKLGTLSHREKVAMAYRESLVQRYADVPDVRKIARSGATRVPKWIKNEQKRVHDHVQSQAIKEHNVRIRTTSREDQEEGLEESAESGVVRPEGEGAGASGRGDGQSQGKGKTGRAQKPAFQNKWSNAVRRVI